jgi:hypothetical protein
MPAARNNRIKKRKFLNPNCAFKACFELILLGDPLKIFFQQYRSSRDVLGARTEPRQAKGSKGNRYDRYRARVSLLAAQAGLIIAGDGQSGSSGCCRMIRRQGGQSFNRKLFQRDPYGFPHGYN